jgi:hypothetical protein
MQKMAEREKVVILETISVMSWEELRVFLGIFSKTFDPTIRVAQEETSQNQ